MTPLDIGNSFDQTLEADENGSAWIVFPDVPVFTYPDFNNSLLIPMILFVKLVAFFKPDWQRINGRYVAAALLMLMFLFLYILMAIIF